MTSYKYHHVSNQGRDTQLRVRMLHPSVDSPTHIRFVRLSSSCKDLVPLLHLSGSYQVKFVATVAHRSTITQSRLAHTETCIVSTTQLSKRLDQYHILSVDVFLQHPLCLARHYLTTLLPPLKSPHAIMSKPNSSLILPEIPIASQGFTYNALTTIKQVPASPARPATPHTPPPIPLRSLQRPVSTAPGERHIIALQRLLPGFPTSFYEPQQESAWGIAKAPAEERVDMGAEVVENPKKKKKEGRYPWHKTRLLLRFTGSCFIATAIALAYLRFSDSNDFEDSYPSNDTIRSYDLFALWVYLVVRIALTYNAQLLDADDTVPFHAHIQPCRNTLQLRCWEGD